MLEFYKFKECYDLCLKGDIDKARGLMQDLQSSYIDRCEELDSLHLQIREYEEILYLSRNLFKDGQFFWLIAGNAKQGPFCPACYETEGRLIRVIGNKIKQCTACGEKYILDRDPLQEGRQAGNDDTNASVKALMSLESLLENSTSAKKINLAVGVERHKAKIIQFNQPNL